MDVLYHFRGQSFVWDDTKAEINRAKHGIAFETAAEVFDDPLVRLFDATDGDESRAVAIGESMDRKLLCVVHVERMPQFVRIISARLAVKQERNEYEDHE